MQCPTCSRRFCVNPQTVERGSGHSVQIRRCRRLECFRRRIQLACENSTGIDSFSSNKGSGSASSSYF
ncbi:hypothetical protein GCK32_008050 [Trichostrongylus colubriformis]|uniref:Uncharacterized protein n=1 Tax=Trichostrongylus colubriformis TaxID=6319 RepID=A0AAN8G213_TRICO